MTNGKAQKRKQLAEISGGQMAALIAGVAIEMPRKGDLEVVKKMIANTKRMRPVLCGLVEEPEEMVLVGEEALRAWHSGWTRFWRAFGFRYDHEALVLPEYREGFGWSIVTPPVTEWPASRLLHEVCQRMFPVWQYRDGKELDKVVSAKELDGTHVILARKGIEADEEYKNKSANWVGDLLTMSLRQRMVLEARYFMETGLHLDGMTATICAGSRYADGYVPYADWGGDGFSVGRVHPGDAYDHWRVREVVSLP